MELDLKSNLKTEFSKKYEWLLFIFLGKFSFYNSSFFHVRHCVRGSVRPPKTTVPWNPLNSFFGILSQWYLVRIKTIRSEQTEFYEQFCFFFQKWGKWAQNWLIWCFLHILKDFAIIFFAWYHWKWKIILSYPSADSVSVKILVLKLWTEMHSANQMCDLSVISQERSEGSSWFFACT